MTDLFLPGEFDDWAASYDQSVSENSGFPFDGYARLLQTIVTLTAAQPGDSVLDLGIGTGNLAILFSELGCEVWGLDFSAKMLALAKVKIPGATLGQVDLRDDWPPAFQRRFDYIVSGYTFHHFPLEEKVELIKNLIQEHLNPGGQLLIGDIAFQDANEEDLVRNALGSEWEQEYYWLADVALTAFETVRIPVRFHRISNCGGIFQFNLQAKGE